MLATQNPIEQEGTYPLPEAQVDRFMLKVVVGYPGRDEERTHPRPHGRRPARRAGAQGRRRREAILEARGVVDELLHRRQGPRLHRGPRPRHARARRRGRLRACRASSSTAPVPAPRSSLLAAAKAHAFLQGRAYVTPHDVKSIAPDVLRHRVLLSYEAEAEGKSPDDVIARILETVPVP